MVQLQPIQPTEQARFRQVVEAYWQEIMPHADIVRDAEQAARYFQEHFPLDRNDYWVQWALGAGEPVGFVAATLEAVRKKAMIEDFYVLPAERRHGYGTAIMHALYRQLDALGIELIELHVRRDTPEALAFWEAQGFRIALYRMRQYRDPEAGKSFVGALSSDFA